MATCRLTFHDGRVTDYPMPGTKEELLADLSCRAGYDLLPCLALPPEVLPDEPETSK